MLITNSWLMKVFKFKASIRKSGRGTAACLRAKQFSQLEPANGLSSALVTRTDKGRQAPTSHARFGPRVVVLWLVINATKYGFLIEPGIGF